MGLAGGRSGAGAAGLIMMVAIGAAPRPVSLSATSGVGRRASDSHQTHKQASGGAGGQAGHILLSIRARRHDQPGSERLPVVEATH